MGRGFELVAQKVKLLASQTSRATEDISAYVAEIQGLTGVAATSVREIAGTMRDVDHLTTTILSLVEHQSSATRGISENASVAADGTAALTRNVAAVSDVVAQTAINAGSVLETSEDLVRSTTQLADQLNKFLGTLRTGLFDRNKAA